MRKFDSQEQEFIRLLGSIKLESNEIFSRFLQDNYFTTSSNTGLLVDPAKKYVIYYMSPSTFNNLNERAKQIKKLWSLVALIEDLNEQRFIKRIPITEFPKIIHLMSEKFNNVNDKDPNRKVLNDAGDYLLLNDPLFIRDKVGNIIMNGILWNDLYEPVSKMIFSIIYPSESIKYLIDHEFQTEEDYRFKKQYLQTWFGIGISFLLGLFSVVFSLINSKSDEKFIDKQYKTIERINQTILNTNRSVIIELDSIKNKLSIKSDSIKNTGHNNVYTK